MDYIKKLEQVERVEISPFIWTRIQQRISQNESRFMVSKREWQLTFVALVLMLLVNLAALKSDRGAADEIHSFAVTMNMMPQNSLYDE
jgi:hypothetical protein